MDGLSSRRRLSTLVADPRFPAQFGSILQHFYDQYHEALANAGLPRDRADDLWCTFIEQLEAQIESPFVFEPYHGQITAPFDHYRFGLEFLRPLVDRSRSSVRGLPELDRIAAQLAAGENVILLANHQTEGDPQAISLLLEDTYPAIARDMIFVAGERVTTDPLAVPFSMGRNLLCIYSKRYIEHPPDRKAIKQRHNQKTMERMRELLGAGGRCVYAAPSGGRDRMTAGAIEIAPFDPQSIEMYFLMARRAHRPSHFYPMALATYDFLPPPESIQIELGEARHIRRAGIHLAIGPEIDMEHIGDAALDKHARRTARAEHIWRAVREEYRQIVAPAAMGRDGDVTAAGASGALQERPDDSG
ncbi:MAG: 1-acyl-sn-glycerol-3-phosphate acyltransferase [Acidobacteria bacterium]|nr:1-acyl-sn-glycerol-3-phosphate acyltransferase [Acidobacteriota bacterium]